MINGQKEIWVATNNKARTKMRVIAFSNCGRIMRANGTIEFTKYRQPISINGVTKRIHVFIAEAFIPKTEDDILKKRNCIDHRTHAPENININDVRNLRWCTHKENCNFTEVLINRAPSQFKHGHDTWNKGVSTTRTEFGKKFVSHFDCLINYDYNLYRREKKIWERTGKCSWE